MENKDRINSQKRIRYYSEDGKRVRKKYLFKNAEIVKVRKKRVREKNFREIKQYNDQYRKTFKGKFVMAKARHKVRSPETPRTLTYCEWLGILKAQSYRCNLCGVEFKSAKDITVDHVIPVTKGGDFSKENIQALCFGCNRTKSNITPEMLAIMIEKLKNRHGLYKKY